jgi:hypothetical protein
MVTVSPTPRGDQYLRQNPRGLPPTWTTPAPTPIIRTKYFIIRWIEQRGIGTYDVGWVCV